MSLLEVQNLHTAFHTRDGIVRAVNGVSYTMAPGETLGIVGESGSGKSVSQYSLLGLLPVPPARVESGAAIFDGTDLLRAGGEVQRRVRGGRIGMIFQDPMTALNPYMRIGKQLMEPLRLHADVSKGEARDRAIEALGEVGIQDAAGALERYPHAFSGGMRQRIMIAMALITRPALLIADEPTTALDVTVQAQILALIKRRQQDLGMAVTIITHDLGVIAATCDRVLVMYAGRIVEAAPRADLFRKPLHPYTKALMASMPAMHRAGEPLYTIPGLPPDLSRPVAGCAFAPRCEHAADRCRAGEMALREKETNRHTACIRVLDGEVDP
ncbi:MAG: ABC transporter ATP-binding protein [Candidatus Hydrogenedentes bacterium]|nr:ABC transporter ATP-binding protein [Candidatus Hydrogenedentota bacterium]